MESHTHFWQKPSCVVSAKTKIQNQKRTSVETRLSQFTLSPSHPLPTKETVPFLCHFCAKITISGSDPIR
jgi:hypothetical protein